MIRLILCLKDSHDLRLVALAAVVCALGVYASYAIGRHAYRSSGEERWLWARVSVVATGGTAWATHFILLLAYHPGVPAGFDPVLTALSLAAALLVIGSGVLVVVRTLDKPRRFCGGAVMGSGIGALHYLGMAAYRVEGVVVWNPWLIGLSLAAGIAMAALSSVAGAARARSWRRMSAPLLLLSIGVIHFCGMGSATIYFDPSRALPPDVIAPGALAPVVAGAAVGLFGLAFLGLRFELAAKSRQRHDRERLRQLADVALEGLVICNGEIITAVNNSLERLSGLDRNALSGSQVGALLPGVDFLNLREGEEHEAELIDVHGEIVPVRILRGGISLGGVAQTVLAIRDQRGRLRAEAEREALLADLRAALQNAEAANVAKSQFLANMSHEIRTPLNGVLGMTQALALGELDPDQRERVEIIVESGRTLLAVLNDILDLSKIEAGRFELELIDFDLEDMARGACAAFTEIARRKGLSFGHVLAPSAQGIWRGDSVRVRQMIYNLVSNAVKFTASGEVWVHIDRGLNESLTLQVRDSGIGIAPDQIPKLFSKFHQTDSSNTRRFGGTGLGLAICRELSELMGGSISVESIEGEGSTFTLVLPLKYIGPSAATPRLVESEAVDEPSQTGALRILAAEDNAANQLVLRALLQAFEITPTIVGNGRLAVEAWEREDFDLILMDVQMPEMDGVEATRRIRAWEAKSVRPRTPILAVSANVMTHQVREYMLAGMDGHVAKPIELDKLVEALERALDRSTDDPALEGRAA